MPIGRISGPMLKENLIRQGVDLSFETDLLYLDVTNNRVGIKNSSPQYDLDVTGTARVVDLVVTNVATIGDIIISGNTIETSLSTLNLGTADNVVYQTKAIIDNTLQFENNTISTIVSNANIELRPNGTGSVEVSSDLNVTGNIHAVGNITADGNIQLGDNVNQDTVTFNAEITSDLIPASDNQYDIGSATSSWSNIWVDTFNATNIVTGNISVGNIDITLVQGNIYYVAENGDNANDGNHPQSPYRSVEYALNQAVNGDTVYVFPGIYEETFPITVPAGVVLKGHNLRSVIIKPDSNPVEDAFYLNGDCTVEDITIQDFRYDSLTNTGYAFKFAPNASVTSRSPYIRNVTVLTTGSVTDLEDPRGFNAGDAGRGVYADGSVLASTSNEASLLFHSCTFITPGVDCVIATNGVRIEWLNCFTYFANRSVYSLDGTSGKYGIGKTRVRLTGVSGNIVQNDTATFTSRDASTVITLTVTDVIDNEIVFFSGKQSDFIDFDYTPASIAFSSGATATTIVDVDFREFGAEIRMIGSASVYGNYGLYGDGPGVLVYAIGHNLAYIGNGRHVTNDPTTVNQGREVTEINGAKIRYSSVDHRGDFRVGNLFHIDQDNGTVNFSASGINIDLTQAITITDGNSTTVIDSSQISTGNIVFSGNTIETTTGNLNILAATGLTTIQNTTNISGSVDVTNNLTVGGSATIGDSALDTFTLTSFVDSDIIPNVSSLYSLGNSVNRWNNLYITEIYGENIQILDNTISTTTSNSDLELRAAGIGTVYVPNNDVQVDNDLTVYGTTTLSTTNITGTVTITSNITQTGDINQTGTTNVNQNLNVLGAAQFEKIEIVDNYISTTISGLNLELRASGLGKVLIPDNDAQINGNLNVLGAVTTTDYLITGFVEADRISTDNILINTNYITTTISNSDLELRANGTGRVTVLDNDFQAGQNLTVIGSSSLSDTTINGLLTVNGSINNTGNIAVTGTVSVGADLTVSKYAQFADIRIDGNVLTTTLSNADLELRANGTGVVSIPESNVVVNNNMTVLGTATVNTVISNYSINTRELQTENIQIKDNFIATTLSNSDLELRAAGSGRVKLGSIEFISNQMFSSANMILDAASNFIEINGTGGLVLPRGNTAERQPLQGYGQIRYNTQLTRYEGYDGTNWFNLTGVEDLDGNTNIIANNNDIEFNINGATVATMDADFFTVPQIQVDNININGNVISNTDPAADMEINANGTGSVIIENFAFSGNNITNTVDGSVTVLNNTGNGYVEFPGTIGVVIPFGDTLSRGPAETGMIRYNTDDNRVEIYSGTEWTQLGGTGSGLNYAEATDIAVTMALIFG